MIKEKIILFPVLFVISVVLIDIAFDFSLETESIDSDKISTLEAELKKSVEAEAIARTNLENVSTQLEEEKMVPIPFLLQNDCH